LQTRHWLLAILALGTTMYLCGPPAPLPAQPSAPPAAPGAASFLGAGSCSASACHNANFAHGEVGSEYTTWITRDPHARAYEVLFLDRSKRIQQILKRNVPAHEDQRCLRCHVAPDFDINNAPTDAPYFKTDGVSCESCHGPAKHWLSVHYLDGWRKKTAAEKKRLGMNDTRSLSGRAQLCATCHVGAPGMEVDHDLLAAGHPRLHFEFAAFHAHLPRHWPDAKDGARPDFETRAWLVGQIATAHAALALLAERTGNDKNLWPEFAEFDCASCHHPLQASSPRQKVGFGTRKPGALPWGHQVTLTPLALERFADGSKASAQLRELQKLMDAGNPKRVDVANQARVVALQLQKLLDQLDSISPTVPASREELHKALRARAAKTGTSEDESTQVHLGLASFHSGRGAWPIGLKGPTLQSFDPQAIRSRLAVFQRVAPSKGP